MDKKKKKIIFSLIVLIAIIILMIIGSTFAYFSATISSEENAVSLTTAVYKLSLIDDSSLIKTRVIPSAEKYVDMSIDRLDENGNFIKPYEENGTLVTDQTVCVDDNLNEICSLYTFTIQNPMTDMELPLYVTLVPSVNTFTNLKYKVIERVYSEKTGYQVNEVIGATPLVDDRYEIDPNTGGYVKDSSGNKIEKPGFSTLTTSPLVLGGINKTLPKATDKNTPSEVTYSIVIWVDEIKANQTTQDSGQVFAGGIVVNASGADGKGITGVFSAGGVENQEG